MCTTVQPDLIAPTTNTGSAPLAQMHTSASHVVLMAQFHSLPCAARRCKMPWCVVAVEGLSSAPEHRTPPYHTFDSSVVLCTMHLTASEQLPALSLSRLQGSAKVDLDLSFGLPIDVNQAQRAFQILGPASLKGLCPMRCSATMQDIL
jgi:hypothetical protein